MNWNTIRTNVSLVIAIMILWCAPYTLTAVLDIHGGAANTSAVGKAMFIALALSHIFLAAATVNAAHESLR